MWPIKEEVEPFWCLAGVIKKEKPGDVSYFDTSRRLGALEIEPDIVQRQNNLKLMVLITLLLVI